MSEALAALQRLQGVSDLLKRGPSVPGRSACEEQAERLAMPSAPEVPHGDMLEQLRLLLTEAARTGSLDKVPLKTLRRAPWILWDKAPFAASLPGLLDAFQAAGGGRSRWLRELIEAWLKDFGPEKPRLPEAGEEAARRLAEATEPRLQFWHVAQKKHQLFDARRGPGQVAKLLLAPGRAAVPEVLAGIGMDDPLRAEGQYMLAIQKAMLAALPPMLRRPDAPAIWSRAETALQTARTRRNSYGREETSLELRSRGLSEDIARASLSPWRQAPSPPMAPRQPIKSFLVRNIGDPRLRPERWKAIPEERQIMLGWLAAESVEAFFRLISETTDDRQWRYMRDFWLACLKKVPNPEVWVVLGPSMSARARATKDLGGAYGSLIGADQAALLIKLQNIVLSEWSNSGALRAWRDTDRLCPPLYKPEAYTAQEMRAACMDFPDHPVLRKYGSVGGKGLRHHNPEDGIWQERCTAFLNRHIGVRLDKHEYMPR